VASGVMRAVGAVVVANSSDEQALQSSGDNNILSIDLFAGTWIIVGKVRVKTMTEDGRVVLGIKSCAGTTEYVNGIHWNASLTGNLAIQVSAIMTLSSATSMPLVLHVDKYATIDRVYLRAVKIA